MHGKSFGKINLTLYLELALRRGLPLDSLEAEIRAASQAEGIVALGR